MSPDAAGIEDWEAGRADDAVAGLEEVRASLGADTLPEVLLPYQKRLIAATAVNQLTVCEKSRRIGVTWAFAGDAVLTAAAARSAGGMDVLYIGYSHDIAGEFVDVCAMWAQAFVMGAIAVEEFIFKDQNSEGESKDIAAYRIRFASGFEIVALTSRPRSLRGRQGFVIFDEAAFHDSLDELLKAAVALTMWGGKILVISTHDGVENAFNELIEEVRAGKRDGEVIRITFDDALADGLYERIALVRGLDASPEAKAEWIAKIRGLYGDDAGEELDVIPKAGSGVYLTRAAISACMADWPFVARRSFPEGFELKSKEWRTAYVERWIEDEMQPALSALDPKLLTAIGEDFARSSDLTVIAVGQETKGLDLKVPLVIEMRNAPIREQAQVLRACFRAPRRMGGACFDASGNGLGLAEQMQEEFGHDRIEAIKISVQWYLETMPKLKTHIEDQTIEIPRDSDILADLRALKLVRGVPSLPDKREAGRHGDAAIALAMLVRAIEAGVTEIDFASAGARMPVVDLFVDGELREEDIYGTGGGAGFGTVGSGMNFDGF